MGSLNNYDFTYTFPLYSFFVTFVQFFFSYSDQELVMAALNNCDSPYGKYGMVASHVTGCHCEIRHNSDQQEKEYHTVNDSGVLKQTLYTYPEAGRREMEERHISTFCKLSKTEARRSHTMDK